MVRNGLDGPLYGTFPGEPLMAVRWAGGGRRDAVPAGPSGRSSGNGVPGRDLPRIGHGEWGSGPFLVFWSVWYSAGFTGFT